MPRAVVDVALLSCKGLLTFYAHNIYLSIPKQTEQSQTQVRHHRLVSDQGLLYLPLIQQFLSISQITDIQNFRASIVRTDSVPIYLTFYMLGKNFSRRHFEIFFLFSIFY